MVNALDNRIPRDALNGLGGRAELRLGGAAGDRAGVALLEPVSVVAVEVDDAYVGAVLGDIPTRRGRVTGTQPAESQGRSVVTAEVPDLELVTYSTALRSLSHGTGRFTRTPRGYETMPTQLAKTFMTKEHEKV